jgi:glucose-6-phosphate isomerase
MQKMVETIIIGRLLNINPFDQPSVELYKEETRDILKHS